MVQPWSARAWVSWSRLVICPATIRSSMAAVIVVRTSSGACSPRLEAAAAARWAVDGSCTVRACSGALGSAQPCRAFQASCQGP